MPQLDRIIIFTQLFWLFFIFSSSYIILTHFFFPIFLKSIKSRKLIVEANLEESNNTQNSFLQNHITFVQSSNEGLSTVKYFYSRNFSFKNVQYGMNLPIVDSALLLIVLDVLLHCDQAALNSIFLNTLSYNFYSSK